ncbi:hypothetical protein BKA63DRAFT_505899 [Paraphoma chrysanthemicola]|nr:hypothetical protein BKA63DRAFT_505899 [Paraphoma chrysanthemicola]
MSSTRSSSACLPVSIEALKIFHIAKSAAWSLRDARHLRCARADWLSRLTWMKGWRGLLNVTHLKRRWWCPAHDPHGWKMRLCAMHQRPVKPVRRTPLVLPRLTRLSRVVVKPSADMLSHRRAAASICHMLRVACRTCRGSRVVLASMQGTRHPIHMQQSGRKTRRHEARPVAVHKLGCRDLLMTVASSTTWARDPEHEPALDVHEQVAKTLLLVSVRAGTAVQAFDIPSQGPTTRPYTWTSRGTMS